MLISKVLLVPKVLHPQLKAFSFVCSVLSWMKLLADRYSDFLFVEDIRQNYVSNLLLTQANLDIVHNMIFIALSFVLSCHVSYCIASRICLLYFHLC